MPPVHSRWLSGTARRNGHGRSPRAAKRARSRSLGGTGLGLAIVKHIVLRHRGAMTIESEIGKGSNFSIYLPLVATAAGALKQAS